MIATVTRLAAVLQTLLTTRADELARTSGLVKRQRKLSGSDWVQTLLLGWMSAPHASVEGLADWASEHQQRDISAQGLDQWFTAEAVTCLKELFQEAVASVLTQPTATVPLLQRFAGVHVDDCTTVSLPACLADQYPGCGGSDGQSGLAALKIFVRQEVSGGSVTEVSFYPGRQPDVVAGQRAAALPAGALHLKDLGFFDRGLLAQDRAAGVHWISRLPAGVKVQHGTDRVCKIADFLQARHENELDLPVYVGEERPGEPSLSCRLLAVRCPEAVREQRLRRLQRTASKKGRTASAHQRVMCGWTVLITDLDAARLSMEEAWVLYRVRWQIELLFKLWKSYGGLRHSRGRRGERVLCEVFAKLLACLMGHWLQIVAGPWLDGTSKPRKLKILRRFAGALAGALSHLGRLLHVLSRIVHRLRRICRRKRGTKKPSTYELLNDPTLSGLRIN